MVALTSNVNYKTNNKESVSKTFYLPSVELGSLSLSFSDFGFFVPIIGVGNAMCFSDNAVRKQNKEKI